MKFLSPVPLISLSIIALLLIVWLMFFIKNRQPAAQLALAVNTPSAFAPLAAATIIAPTASLTAAAPGGETRKANRLINEKSPLRDMTSPQGAFYSAEDADSEGAEGKFYLWPVDEVRRIVGDEDAELLIQVYNLSPDGNFAEEASGQKLGGNIFYQTSVASDAIALGVSEDDILARLEAARQKLFAVREERIHPGKDDKILSDWNGLMIAALAKTGRVLNEAEYTQAAVRAADFILNTMRNEKGRLLHRYRDSEAALTASIDDYAL